MSRNAEYEARKKAKGLIKMTIWVPEKTKPDFQLMADFCDVHRSCTPEMVRCSTTGQMKKAI